MFVTVTRPVRLQQISGQLEEWELILYGTGDGCTDLVTTTVGKWAGLCL